MKSKIREELVAYIADTREDARIATHLGNLTLAGNLRESVAKAEKDLEALS